MLLPDRTRTGVAASPWPPPGPGQPPHLPRCVDGSNNERRHTHEWCGPQRDNSKDSGQCSPCGRRRHLGRGRFSGMRSVPAHPRAGDGVRLLGPCACSLSDTNLPKHYLNYAILMLTGKFREQFNGTYAHTRRLSSCYYVPYLHRSSLQQSSPPPRVPLSFPEGRLLCRTVSHSHISPRNLSRVPVARRDISCFAGICYLRGWQTVRFNPCD